MWATATAATLAYALVTSHIAGYTLLVTSAKTPDSVNLARKNALLEELVELERSGADNRRREQLIAELEKLWSA